MTEYSQGIIRQAVMRLLKQHSCCRKSKKGFLLLPLYLLINTSVVLTPTFLKAPTNRYAPTLNRGGDSDNDDDDEDDEEYTSLRRPHNPGNLDSSGMYFSFLFI